jgi:hypothetical protein
MGVGENLTDPDSMREVIEIEHHLTSCGDLEDQSVTLKANGEKGDR